ncbi:carbohydrate esterase family 8 protein [Myriangium duriaei CBS 260.36]|uniref:Pectinesterase n=1 Tax=Myriangium duriaei CBS 260.36 TaxID=1168546 RepID=A0A9P4MR13_9PEZI|nr:carbohydrate esterase family 8 protein [Myriangium duriaei CBS 260.36]
MLFQSWLFILINACLALAAGRTSAPAGALVVGGSGKYKTVSAAVAALSKTSTSAQSIFINPGTYSEQVYIPALKSALTIYGSTTDTSTYTANTVTITHNQGLSSAANDDATAALRVWTTNFKLYNVNVVNTRGKGEQALALSASAGNQGYYGCQFRGYQDTILSETGNQVFARNYIEGAIDFIFGQHATAWFTKNDIRVLATSYGTITASGRSSSSDSSWYVLDQCTIAAASGQSVPNGAYYLGRPWSQYARVTVQKSTMTSVINAAGWHNWSDSSPNTADVTLEEYGNSGAGASGTRASFSKKISSPISVNQILGGSYASAAYVDTSYFS